MRKLLMVVVLSLFAIPCVVACGGSETDCETGVCYSTGGILPECSSPWKKEKCEEFDADGVNGSDWFFTCTKSCSDLGYTYSCGYSYIKPSDSSKCGS